MLRDDKIDKERLELVGKITIYTFSPILIITLSLCFFTRNRGNCSFAVWQNITYLQLIRWLSMLNVAENSEFESFFKEFSLIFRPIRLPSVCPDEAIDSHIYKTMQIDSSSFIDNAREILVLYILIILYCLIVFIINKASKGLRFAGLIKKVKYSMIIRLHLILFLDLMAFSLINIVYYSSGNICSAFNLGLSVSFLVLGGFWIIQIPLIIKKKLGKNLDKNHYLLFENIETVVHEFKATYRTITYQYYTIFLLYRACLAFCLVCFEGSSSVQLFIISSFQVLICKIYIVFYILKVNPFIHKSDTISVFTSEFLSLLLAMFIAMRSLNLSPESNYHLTIFCVVIIWLTESVILARFYFSIRTDSQNQGKIAALNETSLQIVTDNIPQHSGFEFKDESASAHGINHKSYMTKDSSSRKFDDLFADPGPKRIVRDSKGHPAQGGQKKFDLNKITVRSDLKPNAQISNIFKHNHKGKDSVLNETTANFNSTGNKDIKSKIKLDE